ncbi:aldehyde dehydrogenase family protein [Streptomyces malaysiensis]|uniref:aldehyde dehydrogenase family protein n=1 Tax=Streptomyces malaysiensis TaxID=92644 RepID=UPI002B2E36B9|nr:aldehyde dehydrogenase family protein [Streptomyces malaysiensis]
MTANSSAELRSCSPQRPADLVASAQETPTDEVRATVREARAAQRAWWASTVAERAAALDAIADEVAARRDEAAGLIVREVGKPIAEAQGEVARAMSILRYYAQAAYGTQGETYSTAPPALLFTQRHPLGVAGLITPWNFPLAIPLWKAAPALAAGNAIVLKPATESLGCAQFLSQVLGKHLPDGLFSLVPGEATTGQALVAAADVVSFTGSTAVGRQVRNAAALAGVPVQCEMGGLNAAIVLPDADPEATAAVLAGAAMGFAGQKCTATRRIILVGEQRRLIDALVDQVRALRVDDPGEAGVSVGPVINARASDQVLDAVAAARASGGQVLTGGSAFGRDGWFVEPTLITGLPPGAPVAQEEVFGPISSITQVLDFESAVSLSNATRYGLVTSVHGRDITALLKGVMALDTGMVKINAPTTGVDFWAPFGGEKESSYGHREQGTAALHFYSTTRTVTVSQHLG